MKEDIVFKGNAEKLLKCLKTETKKRDRSSYTIKKDKNCLTFQITAKDTAAMRATKNSINNMIKVFKSMEKIK